jgi:hypothetical protein
MASNVKDKTLHTRPRTVPHQQRNKATGKLPSISMRDLLHEPLPHAIPNRIAQMGRVYGNRHRPSTVYGPIIRNEPSWIRPNEDKDRVLMFEQPALDKSLWHHDIISYARDQKVKVLV